MRQTINWTLETDDCDIQIEFTRMDYIAGTPDSKVYDAVGVDKSGKKYNAYWIQRGNEVSIDSITDENYDGPGDGYYERLLNS